MNYPAWMFWLAMAQFFMNCAVALYAWNSGRRKATTAHIGKVEAEMYKRTNQHAQHLTLIDTELKHVPTHDDLSAMTGKIFEKIDLMRGDLSEVIGGLKASQRQFTLIQEHLLRGNSK